MMSQTKNSYKKICFFVLTTLYIALSSLIYAQQDPAVLNNKGLEAFKLADYDKAISLFLQAIELSKNDNELYYNLGSSYFGKMDFKESEKALRKSVELNGKFPKALVALADVLRAQQKPDEAFSLYEKALSIDSTINLVHEKLAYMYMSKKEYNKALEFYNVIQKRGKLINSSFYYMGNCYKEIKNTPEAIKYFELYKKTIMEDDDLRYNVHINLGEIYYFQLNYDKALENYLVALKENDMNPKLTENVGLIYLNKKNYEKAIKYYLTAERDYPEADRYGVYLGLAQSYEFLNKYPESASYYEKAAGIRKGFATFYNSARLYRMQSNFEKAIRNYSLALESEPNNISALKDLDICYTSLKKYNEAMQIEKKIIELQPNTMEAYTALAFNYLNLKDTVSAIENLKNSLKYNPFFEKSLSMLSNLYFTVKDYENAIDYYEKLFKVTSQKEIKTNIAYAYFNKAVIAFNAKNYEDAAKFYLNAYENKPDMVDIYPNLAKTYEILGNKAEAKKWQSKVKKGKK